MARKLEINERLLPKWESEYCLKCRKDTQLIEERNISGVVWRCSECNVEFDRMYYDEDEYF